MSSEVVVNFAVEGPTDEAVARRLIQHAGGIPGKSYITHGKANLKSRIRGYNNAANYFPWLVLVDLNAEYACAPSLIQEWVGSPSPLLCLRVAVRAIEAWLLADAPNIANFLGVPLGSIPVFPEQEADPKQRIIHLARQSRKRAIQEGLAPDPSTGQRVGALYTSLLIEFVQHYWDIQQATTRAPSLQSAIDCLKRLVHQCAPA